MNNEELSRRIANIVADAALLATSGAAKRAWRNLRDWSGVGHSPGYEARGSDVSDPTFNETLGRLLGDKFGIEQTQLEKRLRRAERDVAWCAACVIRNSQVTKDVPDDWGVWCENPRCQERLEENERPRKGLCQRCYRHGRRFGLAWPQRYEEKS